MARILRWASQTWKRRSGREGGPSVLAGRRVARGLEAVPRSPPERKEPVCVIAVEGGGSGHVVEVEPATIQNRSEGGLGDDLLAMRPLRTFSSSSQWWAWA